jgi:hypothetical protein
MERKRGGPLLRKELDNLSFLQSHPEVQKRFSDAGCMTYVEKLQEGYHQAIAETFAKSYDGKKATVGSLELIVDEAAIASATGLPRTGQSWFKTTVTKNLDFRSYLKTEFQSITWKKSIHVSYLEDEWQVLFKGIQLYVTSEGRYDKLMLYHFRLLDHFTGKVLLNLPFFLHRSLTKVCNKIRVEPFSIRNTLCHYGLIKMIILEELKQKDRTWQHFVFWEGFENLPQPGSEKKKRGKKQPTPHSTSRKRRALSPIPPGEEAGPSSKAKRAKKKLDFDTAIEQPAVKKANILNFPYSDSEPEQEEIPANDNPEYSMEPAQNFEGFTTYEEGETSSKKKPNDCKIIKKLKRRIKQQEVLERVIKERYATLSENFAKTSEAFEKLALKRVKEKKRKRKIVKDNIKLWKIARSLKIKNKLLKARLVNHTPLQILAETTENFSND